MSANEKARPGAGTPERAVETAACGRAAISYTQFTTGTAGSQAPHIADLLHHGAENAIRSKDLAELAGLASVRALQSAIALERDAGAVILSTCRGGGGYFLPAEGAEGRREVEAYVRTLRARALNTLHAIKSAKRVLRNLEGQVRLDV